LAHQSDVPFPQKIDTQFPNTSIDYATGEARAGVDRDRRRRALTGM